MAAGELGVVIVNWNGRSHLDPCIRSLYESSLSPRKVIVVDNGSIDGSQAMLKSKYPGVQLIQNQDNVGFAVANNQGAAEALLAGCDWVLFLNNDTVVDQCALEAMMNAAAAASARIVNPLITDLEGNIWFGGSRLSFLGEIHHVHTAPPNGCLLDIPAATGCALLTDAEVIAQFGPFDPRYFIYFEDSDLSLKIKQAGGRIVLEPRARIEHRISSDSTKNAPTGFFYYLNTRNQLLFAHEHLAPWKWLAFWLSFTVSYVVPRLIGLLLFGRLAKARALMRGYLDFFRGHLGPPRLA